MTFQQKLDTAIEKNNSLVCVGLDSDIDKLPETVKTQEYPQFVFNKAIIDATHDVVCAYKPNSAFYEGHGDKGVLELKMTCDYIRQTYPEIPVILDAKRADIGNTNAGYIKYCFDYLQTDAVTLQPYLGGEALEPFLQLVDKGIIILCKTSNPGSDEFQNIHVIARSDDRNDAAISSVNAPEPLYKYVCKKVVNSWNKNNNCLLVVGATYPEEMAEIRAIAGDMTFLVPGIGAQGGDVEKTVTAGLNSQKKGMIINSSRGIIFASNGEDFAEKAREATEKLKNEINTYRV